MNKPRLILATSVKIGDNVEIQDVVGCVAERIHGTTGYIEFRFEGDDIWRVAHRLDSVKRYSTSE